MIGARDVRDRVRRLRPRPASSSRRSRPSTPGRSVLVAAPTGSGKTVVAEHAVALALAEGGKAFYTTPIKALSNQKYADLAAPPRRRPRSACSPATTPSTATPPVVVMTTEVLRNMIYAGSPALDGLRYVVLDEVHYLQDAYRGPVWEEVIIHLPADGPARLPVGHGVQRRGAGRVDRDGRAARPTTVVEHRAAGRARSTSTCVGDRPRRARAPGPDRSSTAGPTPRATASTPRPCRPAARAAQAAGPAGASPRPGGSRWSSAWHDERPAAGHRLHLQPQRLRRRGARRCLDAGLRAHHRGRAPAASARIAEARTRRASTDADLDVLGYDRWLAGARGGRRRPPRRHDPAVQGGGGGLLRRGAGQGGVRHRDAGAGHQHAGPLGGHRAADEVHRRDPRVPDARRSTRSSPAGPAAGASTTVGYAVVLWSPFVRLRPGGGAGRRAASSRCARRSGRPTTWRPTWSAATTATQAHQLLDRSFAQFQADRAVVRLEARIERQQRRLARLPRPRRTCERGDVDEYRGLRADAASRRAASDAPAGAAGSDRRPPLAPPAPGRRRSRARRRRGSAVLSVALPQGRACRLQRRRRRERATHDRSTPTTSTSRRVAVGTIELPGAVQPEQPRVPARRSATRCAGPACGGGHRPTRPRRRSRTPSDGPRGRPRRTPWPAAPTATRTCARPSRRASRRGSSPTCDRQVAARTELARPALRPRARGCSRRGATSTAGRSPTPGERAGPHLPRVRPAGGRGDRRRACSTISTRPSLAGAGLAASPTSTAARGAAPPPWFPSPTLRASGSSALERPGPRPRAPTRTRPGCPPTRLPDPGFVALAHAWAAGERPRRGARRRGPLRRRLRAQRQAAHRPAAPARRGRPGRGHRRAAPGRRPRRSYRGVVAASSELATADDGRRGGPAVTIRKGRAVGRGRAAAAGRGRGRAPTPRPGRVVEAASAPGRDRVPAARACSAATCAAPLGGTRRRGPPALRRRRMRCPSTSARSLLDGRLHWFVAHLVAAAQLVAGPRCVAVMNAQCLGPWDVAPASATRTTGCSTSSTATCRCSGALAGAAPPGRPAPTCPHPGHRGSGGCRALQVDLDRADARSGSTASGSARPAPCRCGSSPTPCAASSEPTGRRAERCHGAGTVGAMQAWILDESPGTYRWGEVPDPEVGPGRRAGRPVATRPEPHGPVGHQRQAPPARCPTCPAATSPVWSRRSGRAGHVGRGGRRGGRQPGRVAGRGGRGARRRRRRCTRGFQIARRAALGRPRRAGGRAGRATSSPKPAGPLLGRVRGLPAGHPHRLADAASGPAPGGGAVLIVGIGGGVSHGGAALARAMGATVYVTSRDAAKRAAARGARRGGGLRLGGGLAGEGRGRGRERRPGHLGPLHAGPAARAVASCVCGGTSGPKVELDLPRLFFKQHRDHRLDDGRLRRVRRRHPPRGPGPAGRGRPGAAARRVPGGPRPPARPATSSARSSSATTEARADRWTHRSPGARCGARLASRWSLRPAPCTSAPSDRRPAARSRTGLDRRTVRRRHAEPCSDASHQIHEHPELGFEEHLAHDLLTDLLAGGGAGRRRAVPTGCRRPSGPRPAPRARPSPCSASTTPCPASATPAATTSSPPPGSAPASPRPRWPRSSAARW